MRIYTGFTGLVERGVHYWNRDLDNNDDPLGRVFIPLMGSRFFTQIGGLGVASFVGWAMQTLPATVSPWIVVAASIVAIAAICIGIYAFIDGRRIERDEEDCSREAYQGAKASDDGKNPTNAEKEARIRAATAFIERMNARHATYNRLWLYCMYGTTQVQQLLSI